MSGTLFTYLQRGKGAELAKVVIVQPYIPAYRVPLFVELSKRLASRGHKLVVAAGQPDPSQAQRQDASHLNQVEEVPLRSRALRLGPLRLRLSSASHAWSDADAVVVELAASSLDSYRALADRSQVVGVWGHVDGFVKKDSRTVTALKRWQVRHAEHVLAYTERGASKALRLGADPAHLTVVNNTVDTSDLRMEMEQQRALPESAARANLGVGPGPVFAMIGGLDSSKRIDLVVQAMDLLWEERAEIQLVVGGRGALENELERARLRGQVKMLGYVNDEQKAVIARVATALVNPGRVGLIAVESMALGLPIITTTGARHAPEYEYLEPGVDSLLLPADGGHLAASMLRLAEEPSEAEALRQALSGKAHRFSIEAMAAAMDASIQDLLDIASSRHP